MVWPVVATSEGPVVKPPPLAKWLLRIALPVEYRDLLLGDLDEDFARRSAQSGRSLLRPYLYYWLQTMTSLPGALRLRLRRVRSAMKSDWGFALRRLLRSPVFSVFSVLTLGLAIGMTTGIYSAVRAITGPPPGVRNVDRVINVFNASGGSFSQASFSRPDYDDLRSRQTVFEGMAAWSWTSMAYSADGQTGSSQGEMVSGEFFSELGIAPARGRLLQPADDRADAPPVVVISHSFWQRVFGGADDAVGRKLVVNGQTFVIVGVAAADFHGVMNNGLTPSALWVPLAATAKVYRRTPGLAFDPNDRESRYLLIKATLKADRRLADATAELAVLGSQLDAAFPPPPDSYTGRAIRPDRARQWQARPMADVRVSEHPGTAVFVDGLMAVLFLAVGAVLLVACTNLANLALARGSERLHETAVRRSLGASRWRLVQETVAESMILSVTGGLLGIGVARVLIVALSTELPVSGTVATLQIAPQLDLAALGAAGAATVLALIVAGIGPAMQSTRSDVRAALATEGTSGSVPRWRGRRWLIAAQVTVSVLLLAVSALAITQLRSIEQQDYGFALNQLAVADVDFESQGYDNDRARQVADRFVTQMSSRADVVGATVATGLPAGPTSYRFGQILGPAEARPVFATLVAGDQGALKTLGISITHGSVWDTAGVANGNVVVIDESTATALFGTSNVVGRDVTLVDQNKTRRQVQVVGVAADTNQGGPGSRRSVAYLPFRDDFAGARMVFAARTNGDPIALAGVIRQVLRGLDPNLVVRNSGAGPDLVQSSAQFFKISSAIASVLGSFGWVLALAGLYGVLSHLVLRRTREIGVRMSLGATRGDITRMIVGEGLRPVVVGTVLGLVFGALARMALQTQFLRQPAAMDLVLFAFVPLVFVGAALLACYLPARRAASMDPNITLRRS